MTDSEEYRLRIEANGRRAGKSARLAVARAEQEALEQRLKDEHARLNKTSARVLGVLTGQVPIHMADPCNCGSEPALVRCPVHDDRG